jgi:glycosyltransferase involved in cell wall biosynthesis
MRTALHQVLASPLIGGAGIVAIRLAAAARQRKVDCTAWVPGRGPASDALQAAAVPWQQYDFAPGPDGTLRHLKACAIVWGRLVRQTRPVVHVHNPVVYRYLAPALARTGARLVVHFHIEPRAEEIEYALRYPPDHVIACAHYIAAAIEKVLASRTLRPTVTAVPNAIDLDRFTPGAKESARQKVGLQTNRFVVLMLANLAPHKGQSTVLKALHLLSARGVPVEAWFAGEDRSAARAYERELRSLATELGLADAVRFLGFRSDGVELLRAADAFLLPSTHEGLPLSILEAQAVGLPVIASTIPGMREIILDGRTGFLVAADDAAGYAERIERLTKNPLLARELSDAAAARVTQEYTWPLFEKRVFEIYETLAGTT